jgi:hypothetical protein
MQDEPIQYHAASAYVYVGPHAFTFAEIWDGVDALERGGIPLDQIGLALAHNWTACVVALARKNLATLRVLIAEASS